MQRGGEKSVADLDYEKISALVVRAQDGDSSAFEELYLLTYPNLYKMACHYLRDTDLAQDALQETYLLVLKNLIALQNPKLFISWLDQILFRVCLAMQKKRKQYDEESFDLSEAELNRLSLRADPADLPENTAILIDEKRYILQQVLRLPEKEARVILLRYYYDMKINDIAAMLGISRATVNRCLLRGRRRLSTMIDR